MTERRLRRRFWAFVLIAVFFLGPALVQMPGRSAWDHTQLVLNAVAFAALAAYEFGRARP